MIYASEHRVVDEEPRDEKGDVSVLIVSPTRELASQIHVEANQLLTFHDYGAQVVFGGTNIGTDKKRLRENRCDFSRDAGEADRSFGECEGLRERMSNLRVLVLDEADQLLEMGFRPSIEKILSYLPRKRQTLLFSATVPDAVKQIAANAMSDNHVYIDCVGDEATATIPASRAVVNRGRYKGSFAVTFASD